MMNAKSHMGMVVVPTMTMVGDANASMGMGMGMEEGIGGVATYHKR